MVTDTFQIFCNHQKIHTGIGVFFAFFQAGNQFLFHLVEKVINLIVSLIKFFCLLFISCHKKLYPTANLLPPPEKHLPRFGVYVTRVTADGKTYGGLTNIGKKPTIQGENPVGVETYLYDFDGDLYGKEIRVELLDFIRPEMRFDSIGQLKAQLDHDIGKCREIFRDSWTVQEKGKADG